MLKVNVQHRSGLPPFLPGREGLEPQGRAACSRRPHPPTFHLGASHKPISFPFPAELGDCLVPANITPLPLFGGTLPPFPKFIFMTCVKLYHVASSMLVSPLSSSILKSSELFRRNSIFSRGGKYIVGSRWCLVCQPGQAELGGNLQGWGCCLG